jgi:hypothetical protein
MSRSPLRSFLPFPAMAVAIGAALFLAGVSVAAFQYVDGYAERLLADREATIAEEELKLLGDVYKDEGLDGLIKAVARRAAQPSDNLGIVAIADWQGKILVGNVDWPPSLAMDGKWRPISTGGDSDVTVAGFHQPMRVAGMACGSAPMASTNCGSSRPATRSARARLRPSAATMGASPAA